jgi:hypothetical protein
MVDLLLSGCCDFKTSIRKPLVCMFIDGPVQGSHKMYERLCVNLIQGASTKSWGAVKDRNDVGVCECEAEKELQFVILGRSATENM